MTQQPQALLITKAFWAMALQSDKSGQTACQKHADLAVSEALTRWETALPAYPSLRQLKLDGENIKEAEPAFEAVGKLPLPRKTCPKYSLPLLSGNLKNRYPYMPVRFQFILQKPPPMWCLHPFPNSTLLVKRKFDTILANCLCTAQIMIF